MSSECFVCRKHKRLKVDPNLVIFENEQIYVFHAQPLGKEARQYLGYIFVEPKRHAPELSDLKKKEAETIGYYTCVVTKALVEILEVEHVYSFVIGDHTPHVHVHLIGRYAGAPREYWGVKVDEWPDAPKGTSEEIEKIVEEIREFVKLEREQE